MRKVGGDEESWWGREEDKEEVERVGLEGRKERRERGECY